MTILNPSGSSSSTTTTTANTDSNDYSYNDDVVDPTGIIIALSISISIFPFLLALVTQLVTVVVQYLPTTTWTNNIVPYNSYLLLNNSNSSSSSSSNSTMSSNTNYRARRGSGGGSGSGSGRVNKSIRTTTTTTTITFRDLLMLYQGLIIPAGYIAFPLWILYLSSIDKNDDSGASSGGTKDDDDGMGTIGGGGGVYSFVAILTVMGIFCHFGGKILLPRHCWWFCGGTREDGGGGHIGDFDWRGAKNRSRG